LEILFYSGNLTNFAIFGLNFGNLEKQLSYIFIHRWVVRILAILT
jgi:hypothetical protein